MAQIEKLKNLYSIFIFVMIMTSLIFCVKGYALSFPCEAVTDIDVYSSTSNWNRVYLASFPRSGNHWVRFLLEEATHIATSSVSRDADYPHLPTLFPWGGYSTDHGYKGNCRYPNEQDPVVIKTHHPYYWKPIQLGSVTLCLIRHPVDAFYSFSIYEGKLDGLGKIPRNVLEHFIITWREFYEYWMKEPGVLLVRYEDLYQDPVGILSKIIYACGFQVDAEDIQRAVDEYPPKGGILKHLCHYSQEDLELIQNELNDLLFKYGYSF